MLLSVQTTDCCSDPTLKRAITDDHLQTITASLAPAATEVRLIRARRTLMNSLTWTGNMTGNQLSRLTH